jgi:hypothetical protein
MPVLTKSKSPEMPVSTPPKSPEMPVRAVPKSPEKPGNARKGPAFLKSGPFFASPTIARSPDRAGRCLRMLTNVYVC